MEQSATLSLLTRSATIFTTCGGTTSIRLYIYKGEEWWCIRSPDIPDRWVSLRTRDGLDALVHTHGYLDNTGCMNSASGRGGVEHEHDRAARVDSVTALDCLTTKQRRTRGIAQPEKRSGACWFTATMFLVFFPVEIRSMLPQEFVERAKDILDDKDKAAAFRRYLYEKYAFGDPPQQPVELDGQNGFLQFCILSSKLDIPLVRVLAPRPHDDMPDYKFLTDKTDPVADQRGQPQTIRCTAAADEDSLLVIRAFRTKYKPPWVYESKDSPTGDQVRKYHLFGALIGSEHCQHQVAIVAYTHSATQNADVNRWAMACSDACANGVNVMYFHIEQKAYETQEAFEKRWQHVMSLILPLTITSSKVCDFNLKNRPPHELEKYGQCQDSKTAGSVNIDYFYKSKGVMLRSE